MPILWSLWEKKPFPTKLNQMPLEKTAHFTSMARNTPGEPGHPVMPESKEAFKDHQVCQVRPLAEADNGRLLHLLGLTVSPVIRKTRRFPVPYSPSPPEGLPSPSLAQPDRQDRRVLVYGATCWWCWDLTLPKPGPSEKTETNET